MHYTHLSVCLSFPCSKSKYCLVRLCVFRAPLYLWSHGAIYSVCSKKNLVASFFYLLVSWTWWDWPLTNHCPSVLWHCWSGHMTRKIVSEMTYNVLNNLNGTLNPTIPLYRWRQAGAATSGSQQQACCVSLCTLLGRASYILAVNQANTLVLLGKVIRSFEYYCYNGHSDSTDCSHLPPSTRRGYVIVLSVCLSFCEQDYCKSQEPILLKLCVTIGPTSQ